MSTFRSLSGMIIPPAKYFPGCFVIWDGSPGFVFRVANAAYQVPQKVWAYEISCGAGPRPTILRLGVPESELRLAWGRSWDREEL